MRETGAQSGRAPRRRRLLAAPHVRLTLLEEAAEGRDRLHGLLANERSSSRPSTSPATGLHPDGAGRRAPRRRAPRRAPARPRPRRPAGVVPAMSGCPGGPGGGGWPVFQAAPGSRTWRGSGTGSGSGSPPTGASFPASPKPRRRTCSSVSSSTRDHRSTTPSRSRPPPLGHVRQRWREPRPEPLVRWQEIIRSRRCTSSAARSHSSTARTHCSTRTGSPGTGCSTSAGRRTPRRCRGTSQPCGRGRRWEQLLRALSGVRFKRRRLDRARGPRTSDAEAGIEASLQGLQGALEGTPERSPAEMEVRYAGVSKSFGAQLALNRSTCTCRTGRSWRCSGIGMRQTTALRLLAGLEKPDDRHIHIGPTPPTRRRGAGTSPMVLQSYALYPHPERVPTNIGYPLRRMRGRPGGQEATGARGRRSSSGSRSCSTGGRGSCRRPAPAGGAGTRRCIRRPQAFLMDEPLCNVDAQLRTTDARGSNASSASWPRQRCT